jgi:hypothetical protein
VDDLVGFRHDWRAIFVIGRDGFWAEHHDGLWTAGASDADGEMYMIITNEKLAQKVSRAARASLAVTRHVASFASH